MQSLHHREVWLLEFHETVGHWWCYAAGIYRSDAVVCAGQSWCFNSVLAARQSIAQRQCLRVLWVQRQCFLFHLLVIFHSLQCLAMSSWKSAANEAMTRCYKSRPMIFSPKISPPNSCWKWQQVRSIHFRVIQARYRKHLLSYFRWSHTRLVRIG